MRAERLVKPLQEGRGEVSPEKKSYRNTDSEKHHQQGDSRRSQRRSKFIKTIYSGFRQLTGWTEVKGHRKPHQTDFSGKKDVFAVKEEDEDKFLLSCETHQPVQN